MTKDELTKVRDALSEGCGWSDQILADYDEKYARHPATEADREFITDSQNKIIEALDILDAELAKPEQEPVEEDTPADVLAGRLIDTWCDENKKPIPWQKAVEIVAIVKRLDDTERLRLLGLEDDDPLAPVAQIVLEDMGKPFAAISVRTHFFKEIPPPGTLLYTAPVPAPQRETNVVEALRRCLDELKGHNDSPYCDFRDSFNDIMEQAESALGAKNVDRAPHARDAVAWTPETGYVFADAKNANAAPDSSLAPIIESLIGKYWDIAYEEGKTGISQGDLANQVLGRIRNALIAWAQRAAPQNAKPECETCARKRERLLKAGFLKSPLRTKNEEKPLDESARCKECGSFACGGECVRRYEHE